MLTVDGAISTFQSSLQTFYELFIGFVAVLSDLKDGKKVITSTQTQPSSSSANVTRSLSTFPPYNEDDGLTEEPFNANNEKGRAVGIIRNTFACWHFITNLLYLTKRAVAVKVRIENPKNITINPMRIKRLVVKFHNKFIK
uniref:Uncharacterized protein n=1 Tax=Tetranychus urticae TaxID=32264 RepID=T1K8L9_TETUR